MHNITTYKDQSKPWGIKHYWAACLLYYGLCAEYIISCSFISFLNRKLFGFLLIQTQNSFGSHFKINVEKNKWRIFFFFLNLPKDDYLFVYQPIRSNRNYYANDLWQQDWISDQKDMKIFFRTIFLRYIVIFLAKFQF